MHELKAGVYKHYKGGLYLALGIAEHSETGEKLVAYIQLSGYTGAKILVRPYEMFFTTVRIGSITKPRFAYIGETVENVFGRWYDPLSGYTGADRVDD